MTLNGWSWKGPLKLISWGHLPLDQVGFFVAEPPSNPGEQNCLSLW